MLIFATTSPRGLTRWSLSPFGFSGWVKVLVRARSQMASHQMFGVAVEMDYYQAPDTVEVLANALHNTRIIRSSTK